MGMRILKFSTSRCLPTAGFRRAQWLPTRSRCRDQSLAIDQPIDSQGVFGNIVTAVYSAILRELKAKGAEARFKKAERGKFAATESA
jgi:hypothetical protein